MALPASPGTRPPEYYILHTFFFLIDYLILFQLTRKKLQMRLNSKRPHTEVAVKPNNRPHNRSTNFMFMLGQLRPKSQRL